MQLNSYCIKLLLKTHCIAIRIVAFTLPVITITGKTFMSSAFIIDFNDFYSYFFFLSLFAVHFAISFHKFALPFLFGWLNLFIIVICEMVQRFFFYYREACQPFKVN